MKVKLREVICYSGKFLSSSSLFDTHHENKLQYALSYIMEVFYDSSLKMENEDLNYFKSDIYSSDISGGSTSSSGS